MFSQHREAGTPEDSKYFIDFIQSTRSIQSTQIIQIIQISLSGYAGVPAR